MAGVPIRRDLLADSQADHHEGVQRGQDDQLLEGAGHIILLHPHRKADTLLPPQLPVPDRRQGSLLGSLEVLQVHLLQVGPPEPLLHRPRLIQRHDSQHYQSL